MTVALMVVGVCVLFLMLTMFAGAELAVASLSRDSVERLVEGGSRGAVPVLSMIRNKRRFLLMLMIGRMVSLVIGTVLLVHLAMDVAGAASLSDTVGTAIGIACALVLFALAEGILAKIVSRGENERRVARFGYFLLVFHLLFWPVTALFDWMLSRLIGETAELAEREEAFIELVKSQSESGVLEEDEEEMIRSIFEFSDTTVREVMVPRIDMVAAADDTAIDELLELFKQRGHSRIPIFTERIDNIIGIIYAKDLLSAIAEQDKDDIVVTDIMRTASFVPENKNISDLMKEFKQAKVHIAIVVDEYGGTAGIVALEDLLEEIVGEIQDEYDAGAECDYVTVNERTFIMDAGLDIDDVNEIIRSDIPGDDFDTLGGFLYHQLGFIPEGGEVVTWEHYTFTVKEINGNRISKVLVEIGESNGKKNGDETA